MNALSNHSQRKQNVSASQAKHTITGSSFYDHTLRQNQIKAETQEQEMQQQMLRIFGNTGTVSGQVKI